MTSVRYHISRQNTEYSLSFVNRDQPVVEDYLSGLTDRTGFVHTIHLDNSGDVAYGAYTRPRNTSDELETDIHVSSPIAELHYHSFAGVSQSEDLSHGKRFELDKVDGAVDRVTWRQSVPRVAAELCSNLILAHPLPNANHRSSIATAMMYLHTHDSSIELPELLTRPSPSVLEYIHESKRLLTVRRNARLFKWLSQEGVDTVERKNGVTIRLGDYDLSVSDPQSTYAEQHEDVTESFFEEIVSNVSPEIREKTDEGRRTFVDRVTS